MKVIRESWTLTISVRVAIGLLVLTAIFSVCGADKSGVSPNTISLPKGPGSIEGLGESFQPTLNTGTAKYSVALKVPPGTAGQTPTLALVYEGGGGNGIVGFGWQLPIANIQRKTDKGIPLYEGEPRPTSVDDWSPRYSSFINDLKEELIPQANGDFFCKNEGPFVRYRRTGSAWEGTLPDGTRMDFGVSVGARVIGDTNKVFCWMIERETDTRGNTIVYAYTNFPGPQNFNQVYLSEIRYGPGSPPWNNFHFVRFEYEDRPDWFEDCRSGFLVRTGKRLKQIVIGTQGPALAGHLTGDFNADGIPDALVRRYDLAYLDYAGTNTHWSLLASVTPVGADGLSRLPPSTFGYSLCNPPDQVSAANAIVLSVNEPTTVMDNPLADLIDLNGDGLPDLLRTFQGGAVPPRAYLNRGMIVTNGSSAIQWSAGLDLGGDARASGYPLSSNVVHLADMDGDGLADLVANVFNNTVYYFPNRADLQWGSRQTMSTQNTVPPSPFGNFDVRTADLDFDKRIDIIQSVSSGGGVDYRVWFNLGQNHYSQRRTVSNETGFLFSQSGVHIADFNGDRVPDIVRIGLDSVSVTPGLGYGRFASNITVSIPEGLDTSQRGSARLQDITGDGLADLVIERAVPGALYYWINLGNYQFSARKLITGLPSGIGPNAVVRWADLDGNGSTDLVYADSAASSRLRMVNLGALLNCGTAPNILTAISNGIGRVTLIGYAPSTKFALEDAAAGHAWTNVMPFPVQVVTSVTNLDSLGHSYVTQFRYHNGYYDSVEKQFRGFARVEQIDVGDTTAPTLVTRSEFDTGRQFEVMKGKLLVLTAEQEDGKQFSVETNRYVSPPKTLYQGIDGREVSYVHPVGSTSVIKELGKGTERRLESEDDFDNFGNKTLDANYGIVVDGNRFAFNDERITTTEYAINTNAWILRTPRRAEVKDENGVVISRAEMFYDDETFSGNNGGLVTIGNLTMKREWTNAVAADGYITATRTKYDARGNPTTIIDPLASANGGTVDFSRGHAREIVYDARFQTYPIRETIYLGEDKAPLVFQASYDEGFGTVANSTDFNVNTTTYAYDTFARLTGIVKPGDTPVYPTVEYDYNLAVPVSPTSLVNFVETRQLDKTPGTVGGKRGHYLISRQFVDGLGRKLLTKSEAEPAAGGGAPRVVVSEAVQFNARQKPVRVLNPFFSLQGESLDDLLAFENIETPGWEGQFHNEGSFANLDLAAAQSSRTACDATLRPTQVTNPDGTQRRTVYEPLVTRSFDENDVDPTSPYYDTPMVHYNDGLGRLIQVEEISHINDDGTPTGAIRTWTTLYQYDLNDQLTRITDSQNNVKTFTYDSLKRKTFMNDPDRGVMHFAYDDASNLIEMRDAKAQRITYAYDGANRIRAEKYHDGQSAPLWRSSRGNEALINSVVYHYDTPFPNLPQGDNSIATARNVRGSLAWVDDLSGEEHTSYDSRGRVEWVVKRIPDPQFQSLVTAGATLVSFRSAFAYDSLDRLTSLTYPDADQLRYEYNDRSLLQRIPGGLVGGLPQPGNILSNLAYLPSGQVARIDYGNGVRTTYVYDSRLRLKNLLTMGRQSSGAEMEFVNFQYDFDGVSNIKSITDLRPGSAVPEGDPRRNTQLFRYDDLYRLTRVQYSFTLPGAAPRNDGEINYRYDRIGNMLAQTSSLDHQEKGLPVANLGEMDSGGAAGRWNRAGRAPNDPPGRHALTSIRHSSFAIRHFPYDPNGNMTNIDGLICTWDFKDRLVAVENNEMRAAYAYDYTDRRISKTVFPKSAGTGSTPFPTNSVRDTLERVPTTVSYINKYFEVREHDAPTKYVWNGNTRVARVTGSLNTDLRVQRLRVWPGWNLVSLAVGGARLVASFEILAALQWDHPTLTWLPISTNENLAAGTVLWLKASTNATLTITGTYSDPTNRMMSAGGDFLPGAGLEVLPLFREGVGVRADATISKYDAFSMRWLSWLPPPLELRPDLPAFIAPGEAVFVRADAPAQLEVPDSALGIRYYHQDHLGSSSVLSDVNGQLVSESAFYPFGHPRQENQPRGVKESYGFTQKESDGEGGLAYFEARYLNLNLARFASVDQAPTTLPESWLFAPQRVNPYSYCGNRPIVAIDPSGHFWGMFFSELFSKVGGVSGGAEQIKKTKQENIDPISVSNDKLKKIDISTREGEAFEEVEKEKNQHALENARDNFSKTSKAMQGSSTKEAIKNLAIAGAVEFAKEKGYGTVAETVKKAYEKGEKMEGLAEKGGEKFEGYIKNKMNTSIQSCLGANTSPGAVCKSPNGSMWKSMGDNKFDLIKKAE